MLSTDLDSYQYVWDEKGNLTELHWNEKFYSSGGSLSLKGFESLEILYCDRNPGLSSLDVSGCTALTELSCVYNQLSGLDLSKNKALESLLCDDNVKVTGYSGKRNQKCQQIGGLRKQSPFLPDTKSLPRPRVTRGRHRSRLSPPDVPVHGYAPDARGTARSFLRALHPEQTVLRCPRLRRSGCPWSS